MVNKKWSNFFLFIKSTGIGGTISVGGKRITEIHPLGIQLSSLLRRDWGERQQLHLNVKGVVEPHPQTYLMTSE